MPAPSRAAPDERVIRRHHQQLQHVINLVLTRLGVGHTAARGVAGIHGMINGRARLPVFVAHKYAARQVGYSGDEAHADKHMCRVLAAVAAAERKCGRRFFRITRADGVTQKVTSYDADYVGEVAAWALVEAAKSPAWKEHPAKAVEAFVDAAIARLPECEAAEEPEAKPLSVAEYQEQQERRLVESLERVADEIEERGGDATTWLERLEKKLAAVRRSRARTAPARRSYIMLDDEPDEESSAADPPPPPAPPGQLDGVAAPNSQENGPSPEPDMLQAALYWSARGVPVFPLHEARSGACSCRSGPECKRAGKHPRTKNGVSDATTDEAQIRSWWGRWPSANVGGATGGPLRLLALDVDPRHGGDASLSDLLDAHGPGLVETLAVETGSRGTHFFFTYPEGVELGNRVNEPAPGIDVRAQGGYVVLAPSLHASGRRYRRANSKPIAPAPRWLVDELTREPEQPPARVIDFQERRARAGGGVIAEGERNERLFRIGCGVWGGGGAKDPSDLHAQLLEINSARVSPPLAPSEVAKIAESITSRYARGVPIAEVPHGR